jgi:tRNA threonylcarbamoyladenosine biosynthesis protein TsaB
MPVKDKQPDAAPLILAIDTSSKLTSIALSKGNGLIAIFGAKLDERRSARLWAEVEFLLGEASVALKEVDLFATCTGPGGFTGLRVGIAAIKGFAQAAGRSVVGVTSLEVAAFAARPASRVCSMVNAYKGEVYSQLFTFDKDGVPIAESEPVARTSLSAAESVTEFDNIIFAGDAVSDSMEAIVQVGGSRFVSGEDKLNISNGWRARPTEGFLGGEIASLAFLKYKRGEAIEPEHLKACYIRQAEAEVKLSMGLLGTKIRKNIGLG